MRKKSDIAFSKIKKMSKLIRLALQDLAEVEADSRYEVDMNFWHVPNTVIDGQIKCSVCFAGSVLAMRIGLGPNESCNASDFKSRPQFYALDNLREGEVQEAAYQLGLPSRDQRKASVLNRYITSYESNPNGFKDQMTQLADDLALFGL